MNLFARPHDPCRWIGEVCAVLKRFIVAFIVFIGLIVPGALLLALLAASAYPAPAMRGDGAAAEPAVIAAPYLRPSSVAQVELSERR
jgi:hypothetical protein